MTFLFKMGWSSSSSRLRHLAIDTGYHIIHLSFLKKTLIQKHKNGSPLVKYRKGQFLWRISSTLPPTWKWYMLNTTRTWRLLFHTLDNTPTIHLHVCFSEGKFHRPLIDLNSGAPIPHATPIQRLVEVCKWYGSCLWEGVPLLKVTREMILPSAVTDAKISS